jgi:hypothetical protein
MRFLSSPVRTLMAAGSVVLLWLVSVVPVSAAPTGRFAAAGPVCDSQTVTLRKLGRFPKSFGGPLKQARPLHLFGLTDPTARLVRGTHTTFDSDPAVIQNDAPAARIEEDGHAVPSLRPLELLARAVDRRPHSPACSPRAPRGPPLAA